MIPLFLGLTLANLVGLGAAMILGYMAASGAGGMNGIGRHTLVGMLATFVCCGIHCVVFTYFIATAKWIQLAVSSRQLDPALVAPTRSFKALAFPASLGAIAVVFLCAVAGAAVENGQVALSVHHIAAVVAVIANVAAAVAEFTAIRRNGLLIDHILELAQRASTAEPES